MKRVAAVALVTLLMPIGNGFAFPIRSSSRTMIVRFASGTTAAEAHALARSLGAVSTGSIPEFRLQRIQVPDAAIEGLRADSKVEWVEPDRTLGIFERPNDPLLAKQWAFGKLKLSKAWAGAAGTEAPVTVAVADTGVDASHPDLDARVLPGRDFLDNDDDASDVFGHGTAVAGIIAANSDNREGIVGMSWGAKILPYRVCDRSGGCSLFALAQAIVAASEAGARVMNMSLGGVAPRCPRTLELARRVAEQRGMLLVAAAGNAAGRGNPTNYPAACDGYLGVGATDALDRWASFSDHGPYVDLAAPGAAIITSWMQKTSDPQTPGYATVDGTSFASPYVAGLAALLFSDHPGWSPTRVARRMERTAVDLGARGRDPYFGAGRIDPVAALR